jgi:hypothetical protein
MSYPLRSFPGAALAGTLQTAITNASTTFASSTSLSSWSDITGNNWAGYVCVAMEYGTVNEEKILCTYNSATQTFTIVNRNYDGTAKVNHAAGSLFVPVFTATEAGELNNVTQSLSGMLAKTGTSTTPGDIHLNSSSDGASKFPAYADHYHSLTDSTLNTWLGSTANATLPSTVHVPTTNLDAGSLPSGVTVPATQVTTGALPSGVTLPAGQITSGSLSSSVAVALASLASGALPTAVTTSQIWNPTATTTGTGPSQSGVTGFTKYIVVAWSTETTNASGNDQFGLSITIGATTLINPTKVTTGTSSNGTVVTFAYYNTTAATTFTVSSVPTHGTPANVASQTHNLIVIGLN